LFQDPETTLGLERISPEASGLSGLIYTFIFSKELLQKQKFRYYLMKFKSRKHCIFEYQQFRTFLNMNIPNSTLPRIVIIGGGFAGIALAKKLKNKKVQVVLLDKHNYHTFQPLLYQVATGGLEAGSIAYPIRKVIQEYDDVYFRLTNVQEIDTKNQKIITEIGELKYDYLVIATGSKTNYFGNKEIERNSMAMKTIPQSLNIRSLILENFEQAVLTTDVAEQNSLINFVLVGGGPTGVELSGALAEMKKDSKWG
jgi:NADH dehydrogenase